MYIVPRDTIPLGLIVGQTPAQRDRCTHVKYVFPTHMPSPPGRKWSGKEERREGKKKMEKKILDLDSAEVRLVRALVLRFLGIERVKRSVGFKVSEGSV